MTPRQLKKQILSNGYFPRELPPAFSTSQFANYALKNPNFSDHKKYISECERYSGKELKHARRIFKIPNPINYCQLTDFFSENWSDLISSFSGSNFFKMTDFIGKKGRFINIRFKEFEDKRLIIPSTYKYILKTDISKFYPTIYTHSIPWALDGKRVAKANKFSDTLGNKLDELIRNCQDGQTLGIPVGPDLSRLVAEMIMVCIDKEIEEKILNQGIEFNGYRVIDDYFLCFDSYADADMALSIIASTALNYELTINERKTEIIPVSQWTENIWKQQLLEFEFPSPDQKTYIKNYINKTFSLAQTHPNPNVVKYAIKRSTDWKINEDSWPIYEAFLLRSVISCPSVLEQVSAILAAYKDLDYPISKTNIEKVCYDMILENLPLGNHSEVA